MRRRAAPRGPRHDHPLHRAILQHIVERVPGATGAIFADYEGESGGRVRRATCRQLEIRIFGAQWGLVWMELLRSFAARSTRGGASSSSSMPSVGSAAGPPGDRPVLRGAHPRVSMAISATAHGGDLKRGATGARRRDVDPRRRERPARRHPLLSSHSCAEI